MGNVIFAKEVLNLIQSYSCTVPNHFLLLVEVKSESMILCLVMKITLANLAFDIYFANN